VTAALVAAMLVVLGHHVRRAMRRDAGCAPGATGASVWHAGMALAMVAMLALVLPPLVAAAGAVVFVGGGLWAAGAALHAPAGDGGRRAVHVRLAASCAAMVVMLGAGASAAAAAAPPLTAGATTHHASALPAVHAHGALTGSAPGTWLTAGVLLAMLVVAAVSGRRALFPATPTAAVSGTRADACCETYMAVVAVGMLATPLLAAVGGG
jgi:hypothetical protein